MIEHVYVNGDEFKLCLDCGLLKPVSDFCRNKKSSDGLTTYCSKCQTDRVLRARATNKEHYNNYMRNYLKDNDKHRARCILNNRKYAGEVDPDSVCAFCGKPGKLEAHHISYEKGEEDNVIWMHKRCHTRLHKMMRQEQRLAA